MTPHRRSRLARGLLVSGLAIAAPLGFSASSATAADCYPVATTCPTVPTTIPGQPVRTAAKVVLSATTVVKGQTVGVTGSGLTPGSTGRTIVASTPHDVGGFTVNSAGIGSMSFGTDDLEIGAHTVTVNAVANGEPVSVTAGFTLVPAGSQQASETARSSDLPRTGGNNVLPLTVLALGASATGGALIVVGRKRRTAR